MKITMLKNGIALIVMIALLLCFAGCGSAPARAASEPANAEAPEQTPAEAPTPVREPESAPQAEAVQAPESDARSGVLVVYFSATGTTRGVAEKIAALTGADLAEIVAARPYSSEDLNYSDSSTRATVEQNTPDARPEIAAEISLDGCTKVYLGYPIWWGQAPRILSTFVESHDFTGITVIPFCTSGSSDIGQSGDTLAVQAGSGNWLPGRRFAGDVPAEELTEWINETGEEKMEKTLQLVINETEVTVDWEENDSVEALVSLLSAGPMTVQMSMYGGFEQVGSLGTSLPRNDVQTVTHSGDIVLYSGDQIVVFYGSNSWAYTRLGRITSASAEDMTDLLAKGDVVVTLSLK